MFEYIFILYLTHYTRSNKTSFNMYCFRLSPGHQLLLTPSHCYELMMIEGVTSIFNGTGSCDFPFASRKRSLSSISFPSFIFWFVPDTYLFSIKQEKGQSSSSHDLEWALDPESPCLLYVYVYPVAGLGLGWGKQAI